MKIEERKRGDVVILAPKGKITIGTAEEALRDTVQRVLADGAKNVVLDMSNVTTIDSSGVGEVVSSLTTATNRGAKLKLAGLTKKIQDILTITQLITIFETYDSEDEAVASFQS
jgi:anti-sigma B factor antagonist